MIDTIDFFKKIAQSLVDFNEKVVIIMGVPCVIPVCVTTFLFFLTTHTELYVSRLRGFVYWW